MTTTGVTTNPFSDLVRLSQRRAHMRQETTEAAAPQIVGTRTDALLQLLQDNGPSTTLALCVHTDLKSRQVWGLLKQPRQVGAVTFNDGYWSLVPDWPGLSVQRAVELLRAKGYRVEGPR